MFHAAHHSKPVASMYSHRQPIFSASPASLALDSNWLKTANWKCPNPICIKPTHQGHNRFCRGPTIRRSSHAPSNTQKQETEEFLFHLRFSLTLNISCQLCSRAYLGHSSIKKMPKARLLRYMAPLHRIGREVPEKGSKKFVLEFPRLGT